MLASCLHHAQPKLYIAVVALSVANYVYHMLAIVCVALQYVWHAAFTGINRVAKVFGQLRLSVCSHGVSVHLVAV